ncbi:hypothetical protein LBMAG53_05220 [Planctomycetota bacterium]|nr:hypothetical protein LBMAG53_05220 [Planctomycetota bacterium]
MDQVGIGVALGGLDQGMGGVEVVMPEQDQRHGQRRQAEPGDGFAGQPSRSRNGIKPSKAGTEQRIDIHGSTMAACVAGSRTPVPIR